MPEGRGEHFGLPPDQLNREREKIMTNATVTTRAGYVSAKALVYAIGQIQSLPDHRQEWSDMYDMCEILRACHGARMLAHVVTSVENHTGNPVDIFPGEYDDLDPAERLHKAAYEQARGEEYARRIALHQEHSSDHTYEWVDPAALVARAGIQLDPEAHMATVSAAMDEALAYYKDNVPDVLPPEAPGFKVTISEGLGDIEIDADANFASQAADLAEYYKNEGADVVLTIEGRRMSASDASRSAVEVKHEVASHLQLPKLAKETVSQLIEQERALRSLPTGSTKH